MNDDLVELRERFLAAQLAGDRREAVRLVTDALARGLPAGALRTGVVQAAQDAIGRLWEQNQCSVAEEHMATAIAQVVAACLYERATPAARHGKRVLIACVEGEQHEFPARLVVDALDLDGFDVRFLGADVPTDHLIELAGRTSPDLIGLSVTMSFNAPALRAAVPRLRAVCDAPIVVGGHALRWEPGLAATLGVEHAGDTVEQVVATARRLCGVPA